MWSLVARSTATLSAPPSVRLRAAGADGHVAIQTDWAQAWLFGPTLNMVLA